MESKDSKYLSILQVKPFWCTVPGNGSSPVSKTQFHCKLALALTNEVKIWENKELQAWRNACQKTQYNCNTQRKSAKLSRNPIFQTPNKMHLLGEQTILPKTVPITWKLLANIEIYQGGTTSLELYLRNCFRNRSRQSTPWPGRSLHMVPSHAAEFSLLLLRSQASFSYFPQRKSSSHTCIWHSLRRSEEPIAWIEKAGCQPAC